MPARTTRQEARARILATFSAPLDRMIPEDESVPLQGATFADFEDQAEVLAQTADEAVYFAGKLRHRIVPTGLVWVVYPIPLSPRGGEFSGDLDDVVIGLFELGLTGSGRAQVGNNYTSTGFRPA
jgi:hypothetical protein